jgi:hypothetical protein
MKKETLPSQFELADHILSQLDTLLSTEITLGDMNDSTVSNSITIRKGGRKTTITIESSKEDNKRK